MVVLSLPLFLPDFDSSVICPLKCVMAGVGKAVLQGMALGHLLRGVGVVANWTVCQSQLLCVFVGALHYLLHLVNRR